MHSFSKMPREVDLLVVGSGPVGAAIAHYARSLLCDARILMVDAGPSDSPLPGEHLANLRAVSEWAPRPVFDTGQHAVHPDRGPASVRPRARPGTTLVFADGGDLPAYAQSTNVGGMGVRWTCATPRPDATERDPWLSTADWEAALDTAERILRVSHDPWPTSPVTQGLLCRLRDEYAELPADRRAAPMPTALVRNRGRPIWTGPRAVLGSLLAENAASFTLMSSTVCTKLIVASGRVTGVRLTHARRRESRVVAAGAVAVAADAVRTPQLLWASGIRPAALGRYVGEHFQLLASVAWTGRIPAPWDADRTAAMLWLPYSGSHEFHGQLMLFDQRPPGGAANAGDSGDSVVGLGWLVPPTIRRENRVTFSDSARDSAGMPRPHVAYPLSNEDGRRIRRAVADQRRAMRALHDRVLPGGLPRLLPRGSSLHLTGTVRAGGTDDGRSVCDPDGRVWGLENLFVAGNGVISVSTAGNPTLTSVALGVRAATAAARQLGARGS